MIDNPPNTSSNRPPNPGGGKPHDWSGVRPYRELRERIERLEAISKALEDCLVQSIATVGKVVTALERLDERINLLARERR